MTLHREQKGRLAVIKSIRYNDPVVLESLCYLLSTGGIIRLRWCEISRLSSHALRLIEAAVLGGLKRRVFAPLYH